MDVVALVLAGGRVDELSVLTHHRPKAAVPFGGQYLCIDFALSNLMLSGVRKVGVLSQYHAPVLAEHLGVGEHWDLYGRDRRAELLPPFQGSERWDWYRGTADALHQNWDFVESSGCEHVLVVSGDHVYQMDYRPLYESHVASGADLTACFVRIPGQTGGSSRFGVAEVDDQNVIVGYEEKPARARSDLASMTVYLFRAAALRAQLEENARAGHTFQIYDEVLPALVAERRARAHVFGGYWAYARTLGEYVQAHLDMLATPPSLPLDEWTIRTNEEHVGLETAPPARIGAGAEVRAARLAPGTVVEGTVERSVLFPGVRVAKGAVVRDSVLLGSCVVEAGAQLGGVVADEGARFGAESVVGAPFGDAAPTDATVTLVAASATVPARATVAVGATWTQGVPRREEKDT